MPKLNKAKAEEVSSAESAFDPIAEGVWEAKLLEVESKTSAAGNDYWSWEYEVYWEDEEGKERTGKTWDNTSLADNAAWRLRKVFEAYGVEPDTDTDELVGKWVRLSIEQRVIEKGARAGQVGNNVANVLPSEMSTDGAPNFG